MSAIKKLALHWRGAMKTISPYLSSNDVRVMLEEGVKQGRVNAVQFLVKHQKFTGWNEDQLIVFAEQVFHQHHFSNTDSRVLSECLKIVLPLLQPAQKNELLSYAVQFQSGFFVQHTLPYSDDQAIQKAVSELFSYSSSPQQNETLRVLAQEYDMHWVVAQAMIHNHKPTVSDFLSKCDPEKILVLVGNLPLHSEMCDLLLDTVSRKQKDVLHQVIGTSFVSVKRKM